MHVVVVESPAKAKTINKYLGSDYKVVASYGHIRDLPSKNGSVVPEEDFRMEYEISTDSMRHVKQIADIAKGAESILLATDPDREGEAISWHVVEALKQRKALKKETVVKRIVFNEITKKAVLAAVANPRDIDMDLVNAQQARRALDYLVGFTLSPVLWRKLPGSKSAGRVQSVALRLICDREAEIEAFISQEYWQIRAEFHDNKEHKLKAQLTHLRGQKLEKFDLPKEEEVENVLPILRDAAYRVGKVETKQQRRNPQPPFTTSSLQQEASRKLGFSAKQTMQLAQRLYEGVTIDGDTVGLITYMRTDGVQISEDALQATRGLIDKTYGDKYLPEAPRRYKVKAKNAQEAHEAIRPTQVELTPDKAAAYISGAELKLYGLIWQRLMASQMESALLDLTAIDIEAKGGEAVFRATGMVMRFDGFYRLYHEGHDDEEDEESQALPPLVAGQDMSLLDLLPSQHFTEPLPRYSEASLVKKLEELGIGRPSTYASIISVLQERTYVRIDKKRFIPEERGRIVTVFLKEFFPRYVEYHFTADLEDQLDSVSAGELDWKRLLSEFWGPFHQAITETSGKDFTVIIEALNTALAQHLFPHNAEGISDRSCPSCRTGVLSLKLGKFGAFVACSAYPECKYTRPLLNSNDEAQAGEASEEGQYPRPLGVNPTSQLEVSVRKGPYGPYIQEGEAVKKGEKPKRVPVLAGYDPLGINLEQALAMLSLPRELGKHPETQTPILVGIGRFGPYILNAAKYYTLPKSEDLLMVTLERGLEVMAEQADKKASGGARKGALRELGDHPDGGALVIMKGKFGAYIPYKKKNYTLPKNLDPMTVTLEEVVAVIAAKQA